MSPSDRLDRPTLPTPTLVEVPDGITPIRALRAWRLKTTPWFPSSGGGGAALLSTASGWGWGTGTMWATCDRRMVYPMYVRGRTQRRHTTEAPSPNCGCGLYGTRDVEQLWRQIGYSLSLSCWATPRHHAVFGEIDLWGQVAEHEWGWRAQYGRVVALYDTPIVCRAKLPFPLAPVPEALEELLMEMVIEHVVDIPYSY